MLCVGFSIIVEYSCLHNVCVVFPKISYYRYIVQFLCIASWDCTCILMLYLYNVCMQFSYSAGIILLWNKSGECIWCLCMLLLMYQATKIQIEESNYGEKIVCSRIISSLTRYLSISLGLYLDVIS